MKLKLSALVSDVSGKLNGSVAARNRAGAYLRTKVTPVNPQTVAQSGVRQRLTDLSQGWRDLTQAQRDAWNAAVNDFKKTDVFGDLNSPSGFNLYQRLNNVITSMGEDAITLPPLPTGLDAFSDLALTYAVAVPALSLAYTRVAGGDGGVKVFATAPQSAGKSFVKSEYRLIKTIGAPGAGPLDLLADYTAKFGGVGAVGNKIFVKLVPSGITTGLQGPGVSTSKISVA